MEDLKRKLTQSFKELLCKGPIEKITIKDITDKAGVTRTTFYNHFHDKYEILEWIIEEDILKSVKPLIENELFSEMVILMFSCIAKEKEFFKNAILVEGQNSFESIALKCIKNAFTEVVDAKSEGKRHSYPWLTPGLIAEYYARSLMFVIKEWIKTDMTISPKEMSKIYDYLLKHSMEEVLAEMYAIQI
jgi:probable dihydroxyacetone kinase regulator